MLLFLFKSYFCINIKNQIVMDGDKQKDNENAICNLCLAEQTPGI